MSGQAMIALTLFTVNESGFYEKKLEKKGTRNDEIFFSKSENCINRFTTLGLRCFFFRTNFVLFLAILAKIFIPLARDISTRDKTYPIEA